MSFFINNRIFNRYSTYLFITFFTLYNTVFFILSSLCFGLLPPLLMIFETKKKLLTMIRNRIIQWHLNMTMASCSACLKRFFYPASRLTLEHEIKWWSCETRKSLCWCLFTRLLSTKLELLSAACARDSIDLYITYTHTNKVPWVCLIQVAATFQTMLLWLHV